MFFPLLQNSYDFQFWPYQDFTQEEFSHAQQPKGDGAHGSRAGYQAEA